jgi:uncharacterized protein YjbJ (UPF0337 family)
MNWHQVQADWLPHRIKIREQWARITDDDLALINGKREALVGCLEHRYGFVHAEAELEVEAWLKSLRSHAA